MCLINPKSAGAQTTDEELDWKVAGVLAHVSAAAVVGDGQMKPVVEAYSIQGMGHGEAHVCGLYHYEGAIA